MFKNKLKMSSEEGFSLIEVLVATTLLAICAIGLLVVLSHTTTLLLRINLQESARNLATAQLEYIKSQAYDSTTADASLTYLKNDELDIEYGLNTVVTGVERIHPIGSEQTEDEGVQKITITVLQGSNSLTTLEGYKADWYD